MTMPGKRKNVALIHLESISNLTLWQYRVELSFVWEMLRRSKFYSRFYVSATSTAMSFTSLIAGDDSINDQMSLYQGSKVIDPLDRSLCHLDFMHHNYVWTNFSLDNILGRKIVCNDSTPGFLQSSYLNNLLPRFRDFLEQRRREDQNFFILFQNDVTHMASEDDAKAGAGTIPERLHVAYASLDNSIRAFVGVMEEQGFLDDTLLVFYGDHGDELWTHSLSRGFAHGTAPYSSLVWTPLFIYDNGADAGVTTELTSIIDLRETLLKAAIPDAPRDALLANVRKSPFAGIDRGEKTRELAFSQNLYALQLEYSDPEKALAKAYSVTDGVYRLVASSAGKRAKEGGLEFYYERLDPTNSRNLLDFFTLGSDGDIVGVKPFSTIGDRTFPVLFTPETTRHMMDAYHRLKRELRAYVRAKEAEAIRHNDGTRHVMPENAFRFARKRLRHDYQE